MPELDESIKAIREGAKEDRFTYLTILQYHVATPGALPTLNDVLQDADLTQEIGWDLVQMLLAVPDSEACLETVARLGNPREVIIKVMEALEGLTRDWHDQTVAVDDDAHTITEALSASNIPARFIIALGMLAILHSRIKTKHPSRFLGPTLLKVFEAYQPTPEMTAAVINMVRSLSGRKRPPLPARTSSINIINPDHDGDASRNAPDPEAEPEGQPEEENLQRRMLESFVTCVLQRYVNAHPMQWSPRLWEHYNPGRNVPGKKTMIEKYREVEGLRQRDMVVGDLVALLRDLGLNSFTPSFVQSIHASLSAKSDPLAPFEEVALSLSPSDIHLSPGGAVCLAAYWLFSTDVLGAQNPDPSSKSSSTTSTAAMHIYPDHLSLLTWFLSQDPHLAIQAAPGTADALLAIGVALDHRDLLLAPLSSSSSPSTTTEKPKDDDDDEEKSTTNLMSYHHRLTLLSVLHPELGVRSTATSYAGLVLHGEPDESLRLDILEDLLENCVFASLKACAVGWLKEEIVSALRASSSSSQIFANPELMERLQYVVFPNLRALGHPEQEQGGGGEEGGGDMEGFWAENHAFLLQVASFAYFLFNNGDEALRNRLVPPGMGVAVEQRFVEPLVAGAERVLQQGGGDEKASSSSSSSSGVLDGEGKMMLGILVERLKGLKVH